MDNNINKDRDFAEVIYRSLKAINYSGESDNKKLRAAVLDLSKLYPDEGQFFFSVVDDAFIRICDRADFNRPEQIAPIKHNASDYLQSRTFRTDPDFSDYIADQVVEGFLIYSNGQTEIVDSDPDPDYFAEAHIPIEEGHRHTRYNIEGMAKAREDFFADLPGGDPEADRREAEDLLSRFASAEELARLKAEAEAQEAVARGFEGLARLKAAAVAREAARISFEREYDLTAREESAASEDEVRKALEQTAKMREEEENKIKAALERIKGGRFSDTLSSTDKALPDGDPEKGIDMFEVYSILAQIEEDAKIIQYETEPVGQD